MATIPTSSPRIPAGPRGARKHFHRQYIPAQTGDRLRECNPRAHVNLAQCILTLESGCRACYDTLHGDLLQELLLEKILGNAQEYLGPRKYI